MSTCPKCGRAIKRSEAWIGTPPPGWKPGDPAPHTCPPDAAGDRSCAAAAIWRMNVAAAKADREAESRDASYRKMYCEGQAAGLRAAARMLAEELAKGGAQ